MDVTQAGQRYWAHMVAPRIASVSFAFGPNDIEDLEKALAIITERSSHYKRMRVKGGALFVARVMFSTE